MATTIDTLNLLKRKRSTIRSKTTKFTDSLSNANDNTPLDDIEHYKGRLEECLIDLNSLDNEIHNLLSDSDYKSDAEKCEEYTDGAIRVILKARKLIEKANNNLKVPLISENAQSVNKSDSANTRCSIKLPTLKLEPFRGDIELWRSFWQQFSNSIDNNAQLSTIDKHIFLRSYLEDEPKYLVEGITIAEETYETTKNILIEKYGNENRIIQAHLDFLDNIKPIHKPSPESLNTLYIDCNRRIQALAALGENIDSYGRVLSPKILRAFPEEICSRWIIYTKRQNIPDHDINKLMTFLHEEVEGALITMHIQNKSSLTSEFFPSTSAFQVHTKKPNHLYNKKPDRLTPFCIFCDTKGDHWAQDCSTIKEVEQRIQRLRITGRCFLCLNREHNSKNCPKREKAFCRRCKKKHHVAICRTEVSVPTSTSVGQIHVMNSNFTHLQTAQIWITGPTGKRKLTRCILDNGSQSSFIHTNLVNHLELNVLNTTSLKISAFESYSDTNVARRQVSFTVSAADRKNKIMISAFESTNSYTPHPSVSRQILPRKLKLADPEFVNQDMPIEVLIGADHYWKIVSMESPIRISESLVLVPSSFGWILSGCRSGTVVKHVISQSSVHNIASLQPLSTLDNEVRSFWDLDTLGITSTQKRQMTPRNEKILNEFHNSYRIENDRRVVSLLWNQDIELTSNNKNTALKRLKVLKSKLDSDSSLRSTYITLMNQYIENEHVEICDSIPGESDRTYYLPHHMIKKEKRGMTKERIVFDASSHTTRSPSLNDALEAGPNMLPEVLAILLRFRLHRFAITGDGCQAFLQLSLDSQDRDATRFFWFQTDGIDNLTDETVTYRFTRLQFGLTCSPFLLSATLRELATNHASQFPLAADHLSKDLFMDDFLAGSDTETDVSNLHTEMTDITALIQLPMAKWASNSSQLKDTWIRIGIEIKESTQILGIPWETKEDVFLFDTSSITKALPNDPGTKRLLLRTLSKFYDPLGLFSPVTILGKILFQNTWLRGIQWDEILPDDIAVKWRRWADDRTQLSSISIPRWIGTYPDSQSELHVFCDASERAYGAVLYVRTTNKVEADTHLICSRSRLAPIKRITLPRLELLATIIGVRILHYFCTETNFDIRRATLWSDSTVTLSWIRSDPNIWNTFVCNRVTEIICHTTPSQWRHCPGKENPADYLSRGVFPSSFESLNNWWTGPRWLCKSQSNWPKDNSSKAPAEEAFIEVRKQKQVLNTSTSVPILDITHFSSYSKLLRVTAWIFRFIANCKKNVTAGELVAQEITSAKSYWIQVVQRNCFTAEWHTLQNGQSLPKNSKIYRFNPFYQDGLIRLGGRLQFADLSPEEQHPILLNGSHPFVTLLIRHTHIKLHHLGVRIILSELRSQFWIIRARQAIRKVLRECLPCKIARKHAPVQIEAPLPADRVTPSKPFEVTGIDFAGPLYIKVQKTTTKAYIALFTCATTRALHLEVSSDLSTGKFLMALERFIGRRGVPHTIYSDNAPSFHATNKELIHLWDAITSPEARQYYAHHNILWKFIAPRAAWWGGWWERMIGSVKQCLRKTLGKASLDEEGLRTVLIGIEATLNSRPITHNYSNVEDSGEILTPAHFLVGRRLTALPSGPERNTTNLTRLWKFHQSLMDNFWKKWSKEYLLDLRNFHHVRNCNKRASIRVNDVALLQEDGRPRHMWKMARIKETIKGRDGKIRSCILQTGDHQITRPVQLVIPLEIDQGGEDVAV